jgi:two-component system response regulator RegA
MTDPTDAMVNDTDDDQEHDEPSVRTMLVVDDDTTLCRALAAALRRRGWTAVVAHDPKEAAREAVAWTVTHAIVDMRMPGGSGLELVSRLVQLRPGIAIVVLTGYGSIANAVEAVKRGATHYLTKPATVDEILAAFGVAQAPVVLTADPGSEAVPSLAEAEWEHLQRVLADAGGNVSEAARRLGMHRRSLQRKLARGRG